MRIIDTLYTNKNFVARRKNVRQEHHQTCDTTTVCLLKDDTQNRLDPVCWSTIIGKDHPLVVSYKKN